MKGYALSCLSYKRQEIDGFTMKHFAMTVRAVSKHEAVGIGYDYLKQKYGGGYGAWSHDVNCIEITIKVDKLC